MEYKKIIARIADKWPAKVLSVAAAIFLYAIHSMGDLQERYFSVPLHLELDENMIPSSSYPQNVRITLRGDNNILRLEIALQFAEDCFNLSARGCLNAVKRQFPYFFSI